MTDDDPFRAVVRRELLRWAVGRRITCPRSGRVLDVRRAVLLTIENDDGTEIASEVLDGDAWDEIKNALLMHCDERGLTADVIDGREGAAHHG